MSTRVFVNLPTSDLERSKSFYTALGCDINPLFTDENTACIVWSEGIFFMVITREFFATLDGVAQAPGAPEEDAADGFPFGGWQAGVADEAVGRWVMEGMSTLDALLLGRRTYDLFASYWPHHTPGLEGWIGQLFDRVPKYVASRDGGINRGWPASSRVGADLTTELAQLRENHHDLHVIGSVELVQTLFAEQFFDELQLWVYPLVLGRGKRVFPDGIAAANLALLGAEAGNNGAVSLRYAPRPGPVRTGVMGE